MIMFAPEGSVEIARFSLLPATTFDPQELFSAPVTSNIFLLVGLRENIPAPALADDDTVDPAVMQNELTEDQRREILGPINWLNPEARWVIIGGQTGRVVTVENSVVDLRGWSSGTASTQIGSRYVSATSLQKRALQIHAAREFAREMTQMGGR
jgi:hypothetical protein